MESTNDFTGSQRTGKHTCRDGSHIPTTVETITPVSTPEDQHVPEILADINMGTEQIITPVATVNEAATTTATSSDMTETSTAVETPAVLPTTTPAEEPCVHTPFQEVPLEIDDVIAEKMEQGVYKYLVSFKDQSPENNAWISRSNMTATAKALAEKKFGKRSEREVRAPKSTYGGGGRR